MPVPVKSMMYEMQPGGGLVTALGGYNALNDAMLKTQMQQIENQYKPLTLKAQAASQLAYASLLGPQFVAKLMGNPDVVANSPQLQNPSTISNLVQAGMGGATGANFLNQNPGVFPQTQGGQPSLGNIFAAGPQGDYSRDMVQPQYGSPQAGQSKNPFAMSFSGEGVNPQLNQTMSSIAGIESSHSPNPYSLIGKTVHGNDHALGKYQVLASNVPSWTKEAFGFSMTQEQFLNSPEAQEKLAGYMLNKYLNAGNSPQDAAAIWFTGKPANQTGNVRDSTGTTKNQYLGQFNEGMGQPAQTAPPSAPQAVPKTYFETAGEAQAQKAQGEALGKSRASAISDLGKQYMQDVEAMAPLNRLSQLTQSPVFMNMRKDLPFFQGLQLKALSKIGNPAEQRVIGDFIADTKSAIMSTVNSFQGRAMAKEFDFANSMKINDNDTMGVILGKLESLKTFKQATMERNKIARKLMDAPSYMNEGDAYEKANNSVNMDAIRENIAGQLAAPVWIRNKKTNERKAISLKEYNELLKKK